MTVFFCCRVHFPPVPFPSNNSINFYFRNNYINPDTFPSYLSWVFVSNERTKKKKREKPFEFFFFFFCTFPFWDDRKMIERLKKQEIFKNKTPNKKINK